MQVAHLDLHLLAQFFVERRERLVHQQNARLEDDGACQCHTLLLAPGKLVDLSIAEPRELHQVEGAAHALLDLSAGKTAQLQGIGEVARHGHVGKEGIVLEDHADVALVGWRQRDVPVAEPDLAAIRTDETGEHHQERGLARTRRPKQCDELAAGDLEADVVERLRASIRLGDVSDRDRQSDAGCALHLGQRSMLPSGRMPLKDTNRPEDNERPDGIPPGRSQTPLRR